MFYCKYINILCQQFTGVNYMKSLPQKSIFQINYNPKLSFYDQLYKNKNFTSKFPHWKTDRLTVTLRDHDKKHSMLIAYNKIVFESDMYDKKTEEEIISLLISEITNFADDGTFTRFGLRRIFLIKQEMSFSELVEIINLKYFSNGFKSIFKNKIKDSSIIITSPINGNEFNLTLGPMKKEEIPVYMKFNIDNHVDPEPQKRIKILNEIFSNYPDVALYLNIDYYLKREGLNKDNLENFWELSNSDIPQLIDDITSELFKEKLK